MTKGISETQWRHDLLSAIELQASMLALCTSALLAQLEGDDASVDAAAWALGDCLDRMHRVHDRYDDQLIEDDALVVEKFANEAKLADEDDDEPF